jgi:hypothetical protein
MCSYMYIPTCIYVSVSVCVPLCFFQEMSSLAEVTVNSSDKIHGLAQLADLAKVEK